MNIDQKTTFAKKALDAVIDHDDAPLEEVKARFEHIAAYMTERMAAAAVRRHAKAERAQAKDVVDGSKLPPVTMTLKTPAKDLLEK
ncbi:MAG TPA: hypothetical protein PKV98_04540 [Burkholderiaceae bacterium]|nr:hypothetical protein [Burkholderiaceae bacterium]